MLDALRKEEAEKSKLMKDNIAKIVSGVSALTQKITNVEKELQDRDVAFMQVLHNQLC